jgi:hypothetical protein
VVARAGPRTIRSAFALLSCWRDVANRHVVDHPPTQRGHLSQLQDLLSDDWVGTTTILSDRSRLTPSSFPSRASGFVQSASIFDDPQSIVQDGPPRREQMACRFRLLDRKGERRFAHRGVICSSRARGDKNSFREASRSRPRERTMSAKIASSSAPGTPYSALAGTMKAASRRRSRHSAGVSLVPGSSTALIAPWPS